MDALSLFLPDTLPRWVKQVVLGMVLFHAVIITLYCVLLLRECGTKRETSYEKVKLTKDN